MPQGVLLRRLVLEQVLAFVADGIPRMLSALDFRDSAGINRPVANPRLIEEGTLGIAGCDVVVVVNRPVFHDPGALKELPGSAVVQRYIGWPAHLRIVGVKVGDVDVIDVVQVHPAREDAGASSQ